MWSFQMFLFPSFFLQPDPNICCFWRRKKNLGKPDSASIAPKHDRGGRFKPESKAQKTVIKYLLCSLYVHLCRGEWQNIPLLPLLRPIPSFHTSFLWLKRQQDDLLRRWTYRYRSCVHPQRLIEVLGWIAVATREVCTRVGGHTRRSARPPCSFVRVPILTSASERHRRVWEKRRRSGVHRSAADPPPPALINIWSSTQYSVYDWRQQPDKPSMRRERDTERWEGIHGFHSQILQRKEGETNKQRLFKHNGDTSSPAHGWDVKHTRTWSSSWPWLCSDATRDLKVWYLN